MYSIRTIVEESPENIAVMDVFSRLIQNRIIFIDDVITDELANGVIAQMLYLDSIGNDTINIYINSPGGQILQGLAIYDISKLVKSPIRTVCVGYAASMAGILMLMGEKREGLKHSRIMLHEPSDWIRGKATDIRVSVTEMEIAEKQLYDIIKEYTNIINPEKLLVKDTWYSAIEALKVNILTKVL